MDSATFRECGKQLVDYIADYLDTIRSRPVTAQVSPGYMQHMLPREAPQTPDTWEQVFADMERVIMPGMTHWHHPHFHAYFATANSYPAILADMLSTATACIGFTWASCPAYTELETVMLDWLAKALKLPQHFIFSEGGEGGGVIQGTASEATLFALMCARSKTIRRVVSEAGDSAREVGGSVGEVGGSAREVGGSAREVGGSAREVGGSAREVGGGVDEWRVIPLLVAYGSSEAHSSVSRAGMLGAVRYRAVSANEDMAMSGSALEDAVLEDISRGLIPFYVCATLGTTNSLAFDKLKEIGPICAKYKMWLHIDAAYAGSAFLCPEYRHYLDGVEFADSFNFNPHKWMLVNFDCSTMWMRQKDDVSGAFSVDPLYLQHDQQHTGVMPDYRHWHIPLGRRFRSLKLWFVIRLFGIQGIQDHIRKQISQAQEFASLVEADDRFEIVVPVIMGLVCFRLKGSNKVNERLVEAINADGRIHLVPGKVREAYMIRFAVCATGTTSSDITYAWDVITQLTNTL